MKACEKAYFQWGPCTRITIKLNTKETDLHHRLGQIRQDKSGFTNNKH